MPLLPRLTSLWHTLFHKDRLDRELDEELRAAMETMADRYAARGLDAAAARRSAAAAMGHVDSVKAEVRDARVGSALDASLLDLRQAWRGLRNAPGLTAVIVITLALGIGANAAIFSVVRAMLLAPLPYRDADRLVFIWSGRIDNAAARTPLAGPELRDLRDGSATCESIGGIWSNTVALTGNGDPEQLRIGRVTTNFFDVLGAGTALGRTFRAEDGANGAIPTILLGWELFERRFGADAAIVGRQILVNDRLTTVVGVMPKAFRLLLPPDSSVPDQLQAWQPFGDVFERGPRQQKFLRVVARMKPGVTLADAREEIAGIARRIGREFPEYGPAGRTFTTVALQADDVREIRGPLLVLFAGVGILLAIACVNVASLLVARAASRARETALRLALGAGAGRLLRQSLAEGLLLTLLGAAAGLAVGQALLRVLIALRPESLSRIESSRIDAGVIAFTLGISVLWGLLFSLAPMTELLKTDARRTLLPHARTTATPMRYRTRASLVIVQIALSVLLLACAGLLVRAFAAVQRVDPGFRTDRHLTFRLALPFDRYPYGEAVSTFERELRRRLAAVPGVVGGGAISHLPYDDLPNWATSYRLPSLPPNESPPTADTRAISPGLFEALRVPLMAGRFFTEDDHDPRNATVIVDEAFARRAWPGQPVQRVLGQQFLADPYTSGTATIRVTVVGIVPHLRLRSLVADLDEQLFFPQPLAQRNPMAYVLRTDRDPAAMTAGIRDAIASVDPRLPIYDVRPLQAYVDAAQSARRFTMLLAALFAGCALVLTAVGVYGVLAYTVARRRHEFGVRRALGAGGGQVMRGVLREGLGFALAGCAGGLAGAALVSQLLRSQLYAVQPHDPMAYGAAVALVFGGALAACAVPALRAMAVSPLDALRFE